MAQPTTPEFAREFARHWIAAWNSHDIDQIMSHYDSKFQMSSPRIVDIAHEPSGKLVGPQVQAYWVKALQLLPNLHFELLDVFAGVNSIVIYYRNERGLTVTEAFQFDARTGKVVIASAHYLVMPRS